MGERLFHPSSGAGSFLPLVLITSTVTGVGRISATVDFLVSFLGFLASFHLISPFPFASPLE